MYIYTFYKANNINEKIHIAAITFFEAIEALYELNPYSYYVYNLKEYRLDQLWIYEITKNEYCSILGIEEDYMCFPIFINEDKYQKITSKKWFNGNINNSLIPDHQSERVIDKLNQITQHPTNKGINSFLPTYE